MKIIVGLGNPGRDYTDSRHNIGFLTIQALAREYRISFKRDKGTCSLSGRRIVHGEEVLLAMPLTFMNLSGTAAEVLLKKYAVGVSDTLVVCDDLDLELGRLKIRPSGSAGGHRGLQSIIDSLGRQDFCRLRLGIGRPRSGEDAADYVLSAFRRGELARVKEMVERARDCCSMWVDEGITKSMHIFNTRSSTDE